MPIQRCLPGLVASAFALCLPSLAQAGQTGVATWYGARYEGHRTTTGEVFHQNGMTAASSRLPLGARVRVTMQDTGQSVVVKINDRMSGRALIDLSRGAAQQIGLYNRGRGVVLVEATDEAPIEVAEATEDETADIVSPVRHGRRHTRHGGRSVAAHHPYYHVQSVALIRHSVRHQAKRHRL